MDKKSILYFIMGLILIGGLVYGVFKLSPSITNFNRIMILSDKLEQFMQYNTENLDKFNKDLEAFISEERKAHQAEINKHQQMLVVYADSLISYKHRLETLEASIEGIDYTDPEDLEDCLNKLDQTRKIAEGWKLLSETQGKAIVLLEAQNTKKGLIIHYQQEIITGHERLIHKFGGVIDDLKAQGNKKFFIGMGLGAIVTLMLFLL